MLVTRSIVNLNLNSFLLYVFGATVNIENCWLVSLGKRVLKVVCDEGRLTDLSVPDEHELKMLHAILRRELISLLRFDHRLWLKLSHRSCLLFFLLWRFVFWHLLLSRGRLNLLDWFFFLCRNSFWLRIFRRAFNFSLLFLFL